MLGQWEECKILNTEPGSLVLVQALGPPSLPSVCSLSCLPWHLSLLRGSIEALISQAHLLAAGHLHPNLIYRILNPDLPKPTRPPTVPAYTLHPRGTALKTLEGISSFVGCWRTAVICPQDCRRSQEHS